MSLSADQISRLAEWRDRWIGIGLRTGPADRPAAESAVRLAYARAGLEDPRFVVWLDSPFAGAVGAAMLDQVGDQVWDQVGDQVWAQVWDQVWDQVRDQVRAQVRDQVWDQVGAQVWDQVRAQVRDQVRRAAWGQHDWWLSFYTFFADVVGLDVDVKGLVGVAENAGWWWPFQGGVILTERPVRLYRDDWGRLHNPDGPALEHRDGFAVYAVNGTRVPGWVIMNPEKITPDACDQEPNLEIRRVMISRMGADRYMRLRGGVRMQLDDFGELWRIDSYYPETGEPLVMCKVVNSTSNPDGSFRDYWLQVPPDMASARQAVAWTFDVPEDVYDLAAES
jgi:hypothetical protein